MSELGVENDERLEARLAGIERRLENLERVLRPTEATASTFAARADRGTGTAGAAGRAASVVPAVQGGSSESVESAGPAVVAAPAMRIEARGTRLSRTFELVAVTFGVLAVALLLRTLAEQRWVARSLAATLGLGYCGVLLAVGAALTRGRRTTGLVLAAAGCILAQSLIVEGYHRYGFPGPAPAWGTLAVAAVAAVVLGRRFGSRALAVAGFGGSVLVAALLDVRGVRLALPATWLCGAWLLAWAAGGTAGWGWLRWVVMLALGGLLLAWAGMLMGVGATPPRLAGLSLFAAAYAVLSLGPALWRMARGGEGTAQEAVALPVGLAAAGAVAGWGLGDAQVAPVGAVTAAVLLLAQFAMRRSGRVAVGWATTSALLAVWWVPLAVSSAGAQAGLLGAAGLALLWVGVSARSRGTRLVAHLLALAGAVRVSATAAEPGAGSAGGEVVLAGIVLAVAAFLQYEWSRRRPPAGAGLLATWDPREGTRVVTLVAALVGAYAAIRAAGATFGGGGAAASAVQTAVGAALAAGVAWAGARRGLVDWLVLGAVVTVLLAAKAVFYDAFVLPAGLAMLSVASVGVGLAVVAVGLRRRGGRGGEGAEGRGGRGDPTDH